MKTLLFLMCWTVFSPAAFATKEANLKLHLDLEQSSVSFQKLSKKFESGSFSIRKGEVVAGELVLNTAEIPLFGNPQYPKAVFQLKKWTELHNFAPGSPNLIIRGLLTAQGKTYAVQTKLFYTPKNNGFEAHGNIPFGKKGSGFQGEAVLKIVATKAKAL